ncbi:MAG: putative porin [Croceitalea sp.]|nr:putative porin [Croceitalea sp.]
MRYFILLLFIFTTSSLAAQIDSIPFKRKLDSSKVDNRKAKKQKETRAITIADYKTITFNRDTLAVDTSLTIRKEYKYNYLRRDDFELISFSNIGQSFNALGRDFENRTLYPKIGANARHISYFEEEDILYYNVPTPLTELFFKTTLETGQLLDALLTFNTSERTNFSLAYKGFRSEGKYQFNQVESGNFRATFNYRTKNNRYWVRGHYASQDLENEENGGLLNKELQFESGDPQFIDRSRIDMVYTNADNRILGKRYFLDHQYNLLRPKKDSLGTKTTTLGLGHRFSYESKFYQFNQSTPNDTFGDVFESPVADRATLKTLYNQISANFSNKTLGQLAGNINFYNYQYFFNSILINDEQTIPNKIEGDEIALGADYQNRIGRLHLKGGFRYAVVGDLTGTLFDASLLYQINDNNKIIGGIHGSSRAPNFNFLLYQSDYQNFNWQNKDVFEKQQQQSLNFIYDSKKLGVLDVKYSSIDNYSYFGINDEITEDDYTNGVENAFVRPFQESNTINYLKLKYAKEFKWRKWAFNNTIMYQEVTQDNKVLNLPQLVTRNTIYYSSDVFKKAMFVQTGITLKYFSEYHMDAYHPLLGEFFVQDREKLGGFPMLDFFINAKVRQTRIYLKAEHFNSSFSGYNFYAAPNYPYRDFVIRFGLVWNFFS